LLLLLLLLLLCLLLQQRAIQHSWRHHRPAFAGQRCTVRSNWARHRLPLAFGAAAAATRRTCSVACIAQLQAWLLLLRSSCMLAVPHRRRRWRLRADNYWVGSGWRYCLSHLHIIINVTGIYC
jgi:hypothetical protein